MILWKVCKIGFKLFTVLCLLWGLLAPSLAGYFLVEEQIPKDKRSQRQQEEYVNVETLEASHTNRAVVAKLTSGDLTRFEVEVEDLERGVTKRVALSFEDYDMYRPELEKLLLRALRDGKTGIFLITATHECEAESEG